MDSLVLTICLTVPPPAHSPSSPLSAGSIRLSGSSTSTVSVLFPPAPPRPPDPRTPPRPIYPSFQLWFLQLHWGPLFYNLHLGPSFSWLPSDFQACVYIWSLHSFISTRLLHPFSSTVIFIPMAPPQHSEPRTPTKPGVGKVGPREPVPAEFSSNPEK